MATTKNQTPPVSKTWIWLKGIKSKALQELRDEQGTEAAKALCSRWLEADGIDSDGDFRMTKGIEPMFIFKREVAHVRESIVCPADIPAKLAKLDRTKAPKTKSTKHSWTPKEFPDIGSRTTKGQIIAHLDVAIVEINELRADNAKLKNQITKLKQKGAK